MCFFNPKPPKLQPLPEAPTPDSDAIRAREKAEAERLAALEGTQGSIRTDLVPKTLVGKKITLGE